MPDDPHRHQQYQSDPDRHLPPFPRGFFPGHQRQKGADDQRLEMGQGLRIQSAANRYKIPAVNPSEITIAEYNKSDAG